MLGWHFVQKDGRLRDRIKNQVSPFCGWKVYPGQTLEVEGVPRCDQWGLHASLLAASACFHAPSLLVCRVEMSGRIHEKPGEVAATRRTVLWMADATTPFWVWTCRRAAREIQQARAQGSAVPELFDQIVLTQFQLVQGRATQEQFEALRGPCRARARTAAGLSARGKPLAIPVETPIYNLAYLMLGICGQQPRCVTPRLRDYFLTGRGAEEAQEFEKMMLALEPK